MVHRVPRAVPLMRNLGKPSRIDVERLEDRRRVKAWWEAVFALNPRFNSNRMAELREGFERIE